LFGLVEKLGTVVTKRGVLTLLIYRLIFKVKVETMILACQAICNAYLNGIEG
jgi:hypothetical protein